MSVSSSQVAIQPSASQQPAEGQSTAHDEVPHLASNGMVVLAGSAFGNGLSYFLGLYLARALGPVEFGLYALGITVFNILVLFAPLGLDTAVMKFVSQQMGSNGLASVRRTIASAVAVAAGFGALLALILATASDVLAREWFGKPELARVLMVLALGVPLAAVSSVLLASIQAFGQIRAMALIRNGVEPVGKFVLAGVAVAMGWGVMGVVGALLVLFLGSLALSVHYVRTLAQFRFEPDIVPGRLEAGALLAFSLPLVISNLFGVVAPRSDMLAIGAFGASSDVAVYAVASQTAAVLALILSAFDAAIMPAIGGLLAQQEVKQLAEVSKAGSRWAFTLSFFVCVQFALFGGDLLRLFGPTFESGALCLTILATGHLIGSAAVSSTGIVLMSGHSKLIMLNSIGIGVVLIGLNVFMVPRFGIVGAACATSFCVAANSFLCVLEAKRVSGVMPYSPEHLKPVGAAALTLTVGVLCRSLLPEGSAPLLVPVLAVVYSGALLTMGLTDGDRRAVARLLLGHERIMRTLSVLGRSGR